MEEVREAWVLLEERAPLPGAPMVPLGPPGWALLPPPPKVWWGWRDLGRLAKRPSAIILSSGRKTQRFFYYKGQKYNSAGAW